MSRSRKPGDGQESMIVQAVGEQTIAVDALPLETFTAATSRVEQAFHLSTVLSNYDAIASQEDWLRAARLPATSLHGSLYTSSQKKGDDIVAGRQRQHDALVEGSRAEFFKAFGRNLLVDSNLVELMTADAMTQQEYSRFEQRYRGETSTRCERRAHYRLYLGSLVTSLNVDPGVTVLDDLTAEPIAKPNLKARTALARMLKPEFQGLQTNDYGQLENDTVAKYQPANLRTRLVGVGSRTPNSVGYIRDGEKQITYISVSPLAWKLTRSLPKLAEAAVNGSLSKRYQLVGEVLDTDAPRRAGIHAIESRQSVLKKHRANVVGDSLLLIDQFEEALKYNAGLARFGSEAQARLKLAELQSTTFDEMLWTAGVNGRLNKQDQQLMKRSVERAIYFAPTAAARSKNFGSLLGLAKEWRLAQAELFDSLLATCAHYIDTHQAHDK